MITSYLTKTWPWPNRILGPDEDEDFRCKRCGAKIPNRGFGKIKGNGVLWLTCYLAQSGFPVRRNTETNRTSPDPRKEE